MELNHDSTESWRWGTAHTYIVPADGKHYEVYLRFHCEEGYQDEDEVEGIEVEPYTVTETKWRRVKQPATPVQPVPSPPGY